MSKKIFINNFDNKKEFLLLIIIYNTQNVFKKFFNNLNKKIYSLSEFNVVIINNNFPLDQEDDSFYQKISKKENFTYINTGKNIGFLNTFKFIEKLFHLHSKNKHMILFNCEADSFIETKITKQKLEEIKEKINTCGYIFLNNEYWENINKKDKFIKMIEHEHDQMTHVQCFFHIPYLTKELDKKIRYDIAKKTISDMIKENNNIYIANKLNLNFFIYRDIKENLNFLKNKILFEYFFFKRMQYWHYKDKKILYDKNIKFEDFLKIKKTFNIKKLFYNFIFTKNKKNVYLSNKDVLFFMIKKIIKDLFKNNSSNNKYVFYKKNVVFLSKIIFNLIIKKYKIYNYYTVKKIIKKRFNIYLESRV